MISEEQALELLKKYIKKEKRIKHSIGVAEAAYKLAKKIKQHHTELNLNPEKVKIAALLHDIGRETEGDHEINSVNILKKEGLNEIEDIVMHGTMYEISILRGKENKEFLPTTIENKIVAYADCLFFHEEGMTLKERFKDGKARAKSEEKLKSIEMAEKRFQDMEKELLDLTN